MKLATSIAAGQGDAGFPRLSVLGWRAQFGARVDTLAPGAVSSGRHWHDHEDEALVMLAGHATLEDDQGLHDIGPGDAVCWPHGMRNGRHVLNRTDRPCRCLIVGRRVAGDHCSYYPVIGTRHRRDVIHCPDHDLTVRKDGTLRAWFHADGRVRGE